jgi:hypothetical protein
MLHYIGRPTHIHTNILHAVRSQGGANFCNAQTINLQNIKNKHPNSILSYYLSSQILMKNLTTQPTNSILSSYRNLMKGEATTK